MAQRDFIHIEWTGLAELEQYFADLDQVFLNYLKEEMQDYSLLVETGARALAQRFGGDLEESIVAAAASIKNGQVIGEVGSNLVYAWRRHEEPYRAGKHPLYDRGIKIDDYYKDGLGKRTRRKGTWRGQMPGRKFLERAVIATEAEFLGAAERALERAMGEIL